MKGHLLFLAVFIFLQVLSAGCAPLRDAAGRVSGDLGEVSDELGAEHRIGEGDSAIIVHPQADKKIQMNF